MSLALKFLVAFFIGAIPFAKVAMLGTGIDITKVGSKNPGFRNVTRVASWWRSAICLVGDLGKGYFALTLLGAGETSNVALWGMGIAAVTGHCWSPFLGFNGGKGVATTFGVFLRLDPWVALVCLPLYPLLRVVGGKLKFRQEGAIASLSTATAISISVTVVRGMEVGALAFVMLAIVVIRHVPNLIELLNGKEPQKAQEAQNS